MVAQMMGAIFASMVNRSIAELKLSQTALLPTV
jgi:hypothetical protein